MEFALVVIDRADSETLLNGGILGAFSTRDEAAAAGKQFVADHDDETGHIVSVVNLRMPLSDVTVLMDDISEPLAEGTLSRSAPPLGSAKTEYGKE